MGKHVDFNPRRNKPPQVPQNAKKRDAKNIWSYTAFLRMYLFYIMAHKHRHRAPQEWIILGGEFMEDIRHMSEIAMLDVDIQGQAQRRAKELCSQLAIGETGTFEDGGNQLITSDLSSTHVALSLGRFYVWFEMKGTVGPKGVDCKVPFDVEITWTIKDNYDFDLWERNWFTKLLSAIVQFYRYFGEEYRVWGTWTTKVDGVAYCGPCNEMGVPLPEPVPTSTPTPPTSPCPKRHPREGDGNVYSDYLASRDNAIAYARSLLMDRAEVEAGLIFNGFSCSTPCPTKRLENLSATITDIDVSWSLMASIFYFEWRYICKIKFHWNATFVCDK